ncbi:MAG: hypothetical protein VX988_05135 [Planctomycetota bacterium]|nr:hypothetical protein [Planctomycetota bacterium]MEE3219372.1 hypothetical protein [Planctomycetota bacterium]
MRQFFLVFALIAAVPVSAHARIKLATLPVRERVELQLDNGHYTLIEEERIVPLLKSSAKTGNNMIDFSWSNTTIDKDSIQFRPIAFRAGKDWQPIGKEGGQVEINVINVAYPPGENALVWEVYAAKAGVVKVRVSYLIYNLTRSFNYRALANQDETLLTLRSYIKLRNYSGEEFGEAGVWAGFGPKFLKQLGQQEEIQMLVKRFPEVPIVKTFSFDWYTHGQLNPDKPFASPILMHYELTNDEKNKLGAFPLQPGKVRIFIDDGRGGQAFLGEDVTRLTPLDDKMRLYLGQSRDIVCSRTIEQNKRHVVRGNLHHQELTIKYELENFRDKPATLNIIEQLNRVATQYAGNPHGDVEWELGDTTSEEIRFSYDKGNATPALHVDLPARPKDENAEVEKKVVRFHFTLKNIW